MINVVRVGRAKKDGLIFLGPYGRVSTDQDDQRNSLASQREYFAREIRATPGLALYDEYYDEGISGTSLKKRDSFNRMVADARAGKLDVIVTKEVSRFARNTVDVLEITRELKRLGVQVIFLSDGINTFDNDGELRLTIMASLAQDESRKTSERVKWGQTRRMEQGVVFGRSMLGYDLRDGQLFVNPEGAQVVRLIFHQYLYEGLGAFRIARCLEEWGVPAYRGESRWTPKVVHSILRNEKYVGDLEQKKTYTPDYLSHSKQYNRGAEEKVYLRDHHEPIISRGMWNAVQEEIRKRGELMTQEQRSKHSNEYWCSGKLRCADCGAHLMRRVRRLTDGGERRAWICSEAVRFGSRKIGADGKPVGCDTNSVNEQVLKYCVRYCIQHVQFHQERLVEEILSEIAAVQQQQNPYDIGRLEREVKREEEKKVRAVQLRLDGEINAEDLRLTRAASDLAIAGLQEQIRKARDFERQQERQAEQISGYAARVREILAGEDAMGQEGEAFLGEMLEQVLVYQRDEVEIRLKAVPFAFRLRYVTGGRGESYAVKVNYREQVWEGE